MIDAEDELLKKFIDKNLGPEDISEELNTDINKYMELISKKYSMNGQELEQLKALEDKIKLQAKKENYNVSFLFGVDTSELEKILKELEESNKK